MQCHFALLLKDLSRADRHSKRPSCCDICLLITRISVLQFLDVALKPSATLLLQSHEEMLLVLLCRLIFQFRTPTRVFCLPFNHIPDVCTHLDSTVLTSVNINWILFPLSGSVDSENETAVLEPKVGKETIDLKEVMRVDHILASLQRKVCWNGTGSGSHASLLNNGTALGSFYIFSNKRKSLDKTHVLIIHEIELWNNMECICCLSSSIIFLPCWQYFHLTGVNMG